MCKIFGGKHRSIEFTKKWIYACLVELTEAVIVEEFDCTSTPRSTETQQQREEHNK